MSCQGITRLNLLLLAQTIETAKKRNRTDKSDKHIKETVEKDDSKRNRKKLQFPYVVQAQYEHRTAADTHLQYHCA